MVQSIRPPPPPPTPESPPKTCRRGVRPYCEGGLLEFFLVLAIGVGPAVIMYLVGTL